MRNDNDIGLEWLSVGLDHLSPSQLLTSTPSWIFKYLHLGKDRRKIVVGENAALGSAVHNAIQNVLCGIPTMDAIREAQIEFDMHDANEDNAKRIKYRGIIPQMVQNGVDVLLEKLLFQLLSIVTDTLFCLVSDSDSEYCTLLPIEPGIQPETGTGS